MVNGREEGSEEPAVVGGGWWPFRTGRTTTLMLDGEDVPSIVNPTACVAWVERSCTLSLRGAPHTHKCVQSSSRGR